MKCRELGFWFWLIAGFKKYDPLLWKIPFWPTKHAHLLLLKFDCFKKSKTFDVYFTLWKDC